MQTNNYSVEKTLQALYYLQSKTEKHDKMSLIKLLFFADRFHVRAFCVPLLNDQYTAMQQGPVCSRTYDLIKKGQYYDYLPRNMKSFVIENLSLKNGTEVTVKNTGFDRLSRSDIMALDFAVEHFGKFEKKELSKISHAYPEWAKFKVYFDTKVSSAEPMDYLDFFNNPDPHSRYIDCFLDGKDPYAEDNELLAAKKEEYKTLLCR